MTVTVTVTVMVKVTVVDCGLTSDWALCWLKMTWLVSTLILNKHKFSRIVTVVTVTVTVTVMVTVIVVDCGLTPD